MSDAPAPKRLKFEPGDAPEAVDVTGEAADADGDEVVELNEEERAHTAAVEQLEDFQRELDKVNDEASDRVLAVEQEYNRKRRPIYTKRSEVIKTLPHFWQRALLGHASFASSLSEDDLGVLEFCTEVDVEDFDDIKSGFKITFKFSPDSPYFSNTTLTKTYRYSDSGRVSVQGTTPDWNEGYEPQGRGPGKRAAGKDYVLMEWIAQEEDVAQIDETSEWLKEDIWPNPLKYFFAEEAPGGEVYDGEFDEGVEVLEGEEEDGEGYVLDDEGEGEGLEDEYAEGEAELAGEEELAEGEYELDEGADGEEFVGGDDGEGDGEGEEGQ